MNLAVEKQNRLELCAAGKCGGVVVAHDFQGFFVGLEIKNLLDAVLGGPKRGVEVGGLRA